MSEELPLEGGATSVGVVRIGGTTRRPVRPSSPLMRDVLAHLQRSGFDAAPRWLGVDEQGRDILSWIEGDTFTDRSKLHPYIGDPPERIVFADEQIAAAMRLLRRYHDTFGELVVCHGDYGPWNLVWRDGMPVGLIDFDDLHVGDPSNDVAYALRMFVSYGLAQAPPGELVGRTRSALAAYGSAFDVPSILAREYDAAEERCRRNRWHRQRARLPIERAWLAKNRDLF